MARSGRSKPDHPCLARLVRLSSPGYDADFDSEIQRLRPDWFPSKDKGVKEELMRRAKTGRARPEHRSSLDNALIQILLSAGACYDPDFAGEIRRIRPDWFDAKLRLRGRILEDAESIGAGVFDNRWRKAYVIRLTNVRGKFYDEDFDQKIRKLVVPWPLKDRWDERRDEMKQKALEEIGRGVYPAAHSSLGQIVRRFGRPDSDCFDPEFAEEFKRVAPNLFYIIDFVNPWTLARRMAAGEELSERQRKLMVEYGEAALGLKAV